ncbi:efflux RND transporter periplasmic adaptor subunit [soil metagenome]
MSKKRTFITAAIAITIALVLINIISKKFYKSAPPAVPSTLVEAITAKGEPWQHEIHATGTLLANEGITVAAAVAGHVTQIFFQSGDLVKTGTPLIQLDQGELKAHLDSAAAQLALSEANYRRSASLFQRKIVTGSDMDKALANLRTDQANVALARANLAHTMIVAPFSGRLGIKKVDVGSYISAGQALVNLQDASVLKVNFNIPEVFLNEVAIGDKVIIRSQAFPGEAFSGKITAFESVLNQDTRSLLTQAAIPNPTGKLRPGTFAEVTAYFGQPRLAVSIPQTAVAYSLENSYVFKIVAGKAVKTTVKVGMQQQDQVEILQGLKAGDKIIISGQDKITDGAAVTTAFEKL